MLPEPMCVYIRRISGIRPPPSIVFDEFGCQQHMAPLGIQAQRQEASQNPEGELGGNKGRPFSMEEAKSSAPELTAPTYVFFQVTNRAAPAPRCIPRWSGPVSFFSPMENCRQSSGGTSKSPGRGPSYIRRSTSGLSPDFDEDASVSLRFWRVSRFRGVAGVSGRARTERPPPPESIPTPPAPGPKPSPPHASLGRLSNANVRPATQRKFHPLTHPAGVRDPQSRISAMSEIRPPQVGPPWGPSRRNTDLQSTRRGRRSVEEHGTGAKRPEFGYPVLGGPKHGPRKQVSAKSASKRNSALFIGGWKWVDCSKKLKIVWTHKRIFPSSTAATRACGAARTVCAPRPADRAFACRPGARMHACLSSHMYAANAPRARPPA